MHTIPFSSNLNNKLNNRVFFTIRKRNPNIREGMECTIVLKNKAIFNTIIIEKYTRFFGLLPPGYVQCDTGFTYDESLIFYQRIFKCATLQQLKNTYVDIQVHKHI